MPAPKHPIRVLIVDDNKLLRDMIRAILELDTGIIVAGEAENGLEAIDRVETLKPDIVTMDIEMPVMGGLEAIEKIIARHPIPILVVTAMTGVRTAFAAISKGALEVMEKPNISLEQVSELQNKIRYLARVNVSALLNQVEQKKVRKLPLQGCMAGRGVVAIAASTGGPQAIYTILSRLPATFPVPIVICQHIANGFTQGMVDWLNGGTRLQVVVAQHGTCLAPGHAYVNPAEHSMRVTQQGMIILGNRVDNQIYQPSCNTLLTSIARAYGHCAIGLIMSGMGDDGIAGMRDIKLAGGITLAQDAQSSVIYGMNRLAVESGCIQSVVQLGDIPELLMQRTGIAA